MVDLNRLHSGIRLIREVIKTSKRKNTMWSKQQQNEKIDKQKNPHTSKSRNK